VIQAGTSVAAAFLASESEEPSPLLPHLSELIVGLVAFTLLFLFLRAKVFPVFERVFAERTEAIEGSIAKAQQDRAEAKALLERYQAQLADARDEAGRIRTEAQSQRAEIVEEARVEARTEAQRILESATAQIASERQQALAELRREVGTLAVDLASRIVGESLQDDARRNGTVERYLSELEGTAAPAGTTR
jgi:F-type H+-transporting ATPase subunit b